MRKTRIWAVVLALLLMGGGVFGVERAFSMVRDTILAQHQQTLTDTAYAVDRTLDRVLSACREELDRALAVRAGSGEETLPDDIRQELSASRGLTRAVLLLDGEEVRQSTDARADYHLKALSEWVSLCFREDGEGFLAVRQEREGLCAAVVLDLEKLAELLAEESAVNPREGMILVDASGCLAVRWDVDGARVSAVTLGWQQEPEQAMALTGAAGESMDAGAVTGSGQARWSYALLGSAAGENGLFAVCLLDDHAEHLRELQTVARLVGISVAVLAAGGALLLWFSTALSRENARAHREMAGMHRRQQALEAIQEKSQNLSHLQRLETLGTLTSSIAHEFNNLLTPIMSCSLMALEQLPEEQTEVYDNLLAIYDASKKARTIVSRLSDLSRKNADKTFKPVSVDEIIRKTLDVAMPAKGKEVEVKLNLNCWDRRVRGNDVQLTQLFLNLILNAFDAMGEGGRLEITTGFDDRQMRVTVRDTGCGMSEQTQRRIFDPFFTTKSAGKGTGLGLAICRQILDDHKGSISVQSRPGEGTAFLVTLPLACEGE